MPLRYRLEYQEETYLGLELAANARFSEARALHAAGFGGSCIYLVGYAAEMYLKSSYFRFSGARPTDAVRTMLRPAVVTGRRLIPNVDHESYHSLRFWALLLRERRKEQNRPLPAAIAAPFLSRTRRLYQNWFVGMRYQPDQALTREVETALDDVAWLRNNYNALWR